MDREQAKALAPLIQAFGDGEEIQFLSKGSKNFVTVHYPSFASAPENYRIKPAPQTFWVNVYDGSNTDNGPYLHNTHKSAAMGVGPAGRTIKVREVTDEG